MAVLPTITIGMDEEFKQALKETREELLVAREALSEERIRQIVREELEAWEQRQLEALRNQCGIPTLRLFTDRLGSRNSQHAPSDQHAEAIVSPLARVEE